MAQKDRTDAPFRWRLIAQQILHAWQLGIVTVLLPLGIANGANAFDPRSPDGFTGHFHVAIDSRREGCRAVLLNLAGGQRGGRII